MQNFCTLFDSNYLTRGLALYHSLQHHCPSFHLYVFAFNEEAYRCLQQLNYPHCTPISLAEFEDEALLQIKPTRSVAEYCWTCTSSTILYCLEKFQLPSCTYLDADMFFYSDPQVLFDEMGDHSILISGHNYTPAYDQSATSGIYCVQFACFKNDERGLTALKWWRERCIEWCYARYEDGKFGDQKYLDDWPVRFEGVHVLQHRGEGLAPWNIQQFDVKWENGVLTVTDRKTRQSWPAIYFHFHAVKFYTDGKVSLCGPLYELEEQHKQLFYFPYLKQLIALEAGLQQTGFVFNANGSRQQAPGKREVFLQFMKETLLMMKIGKTSPFHLKNFNFSRHYHYYRTDELV